MGHAELLSYISHTEETNNDWNQALQKLFGKKTKFILGWTWNNYF